MPKLLTIQIPQPCGEDPSKMLPSEKGSYCLSCNKEVIDFTGMSDYALAAFFKKNSDNVCGRFYPDQLDRAIPLPKKELPWLKYFFTIAIPAFLFSLKSSGQVKTDHDTEIVAKTQQPGSASPTPSRVLKGIVTDENGNPIEAASVRIVNTAKGTATDQNGHFSLVVAPQDSILRVTSVGITARDVILYSQNNINITVQRTAGQEISDVLVTVMAGEIESNVVSHAARVETRKFTGKVVDQNGKPVEAASVRILNSRRGTVTDQSGAFEIGLHRKDAVISISGIGIVTKEISVAQESTGNIIVERAVEDLEKVTVTTARFDNYRTGKMVGEVSYYAKKVARQEKPAFQQLNTYKVNDELNIYPNPIHSGSDLNISWKNKIQTDQLIEIFSADGRLIQKETVRVTGKISACSFVLKHTVPGFYIFMVTDMKTGRKISREFIVE